jgi:hypothetical protein
LRELQLIEMVTVSGRGICVGSQVWHTDAEPVSDIRALVVIDLLVVWHQGLVGDLASHGDLLKPVMKVVDV